MEIIFSYISGVGSPINGLVLALNKSTELFFKGKLYSDTIKRIMVIFVIQNLNESERLKPKSKYAKSNDGVALNIYVDNRSLLEKDLINQILLVGSIISEALVENKRLGKLDIDLKMLDADLAVFFKSIISRARQMGRRSG